LFELLFDEFSTDELVPPPPHETIKKIESKYNLCI